MISYNVKENDNYSLKIHFDVSVYDIGNTQTTLEDLVCVMYIPFDRIQYDDNIDNILLESEILRELRTFELDWHKKNKEKFNIKGCVVFSYIFEEDVYKDEITATAHELMLRTLYF